MTTHRITAWSAKRAGAGITITGTGSDGQRVKLARILTIEAGEDGPVAVRDNGAQPAERFLLA